MNYEIFLIQNNIDEINKFPNIEDLYDMDKESLLKLKELFDQKFPKLQRISEKQKAEKLKKLSSNFNDIDLDLDEENISDEELELREFRLNADDDNEIDLPRLYSFLLAEIKQREYQEGIISFFLNEDSLLKLTENNFNLNPEIENGSGINTTKDSNFISENNSDFPSKDNKDITENKNQSTSIIDKSVEEKNLNGNILKNFDPSECSLKKIKEKLHSKSSKLAIKQMLLKTKQDSTKLLVGTNNITNMNNHSNLSSNNTTSTNTNRRGSVRNIQDIPNNSLKNASSIQKNKHIDGNKLEKGLQMIVNDFDMDQDSYLKKKKKKKREDTVDKKGKKDDTSSYVKRKNFPVPEVKSFIRKEESFSHEKEHKLNKNNDMLKNNKRIALSKDIIKKRANENTFNPNQGNHVLIANQKTTTNRDLKDDESNNKIKDEKDINEKDKDKINNEKIPLKVKNIISVRHSLEVNDKSNLEKNALLSRSLDSKLLEHNQKLKKYFLETKPKNKIDLINKSLLSPIELYRIKNPKKIGTQNLKTTIEESNPIKEKLKISLLKKDFKKEKKLKSILSKSDGDIELNVDIENSEREKNNLRVNYDNENNIEKDLNKNKDSGFNENETNDENSKLKNEENIDSKRDKIILNDENNNKTESHNYLSGGLNSSANPEMISQIKQVTEEMLMKYDSSKIKKNKYEGQDSSDEQEQSNEHEIENDDYSALLKLDDIDKIHNINKHNHQDREHKENFLDKDYKVKENIDSKEIKKNLNKIEIFKSSGLKNTDKDILIIRDTNNNQSDLNSNLVNVLEINCKEKHQVDINTIPSKTENENNNKNGNTNKLEDLLFYETDDKNGKFSTQNREKNSKTNDKPGIKKNNQNLNNKEAKNAQIAISKNPLVHKDSNLKEIKNQQINNKQYQKENQKFESENKKDNKNATANFFSNRNLNKTGTLKLTNYKESRAYSGKIPLFSLQKQKIIINNAIPDYTKHFNSFNEILTGFYLPADSKGFDAEGALRILYENFKNLYIFELKEETSSSKINSINRNIVEAENEIIKNRIRKVSEFLLNDQNYLSEERYYIFQKIQELQKKEAYDLNSNIGDFDKNHEENQQNELSETVNKNIEFFRKNKMFFRVVLSRPEIYDIMCYTLGKKCEWRELPHGLLLGQSWNLLWTYSSPGINFSNLFTWQKVNHFINNRQLSRKDLLKKSLERIKKMNPKLTNQFDIMPKTFILAKEYLDFVDEFTRNKNNLNNLWIVKPVGKSRGRGIYLINELCEVPMVDSFLVQKYLTTPFLIDGYKFDMRIYVLLTSVNPLEAFLYKDGFARVSNMKFSVGNIDNKLVHLTNAAIQNKHAAKGQSYEKVFGGSKISLELLKQKMHRAAGVDFDKQIWPQVKSIVLKSLVACQHDMPYCPSGFELFGYDVIIDQDLKCWLLEVNSSPSLDRTSVLDDDIKLRLVDDILNLVNPMNFDRNALIDVLERRLNINKSSAALNKNTGNGTGGNSGVYLYSPSVQLNLDLNSIFKGEMPRMFGETPRKMGKFEMIAPSEEASHLIKITGGEKKYNNKKS